MNITLIGDRIAGMSTVLGYSLVSLCGAAQWLHTLFSGSAQGVSPMFLTAYAVALMFLQVSFRLNRIGPFFEIGNALGLFNALMMLGAWWWVGV